MSVPIRPGPLTSASLPAEVTSAVTQARKSADSTACQRIQTLGFVHQARLSQLNRTVATLTAQYGANSAQVKAAQAAVASAKVTIARLAMLKDQASTAVPPVTATGWALYGHIYNAQLQPVSAYTVFLVDGEKTYQQGYGFAYTDATGYFLLSYAGTQTQSQGQSQTQGEAAPQLFLEIANAKGQPIYLSATQFKPALGSATYQNVTLPSGEQPIGDPPQAIRNIAMPGKGG
jgi:hypothetical protein